MLIAPEVIKQVLKLFAAGAHLGRRLDGAATRRGRAHRTSTQ